MTNITTTTTVVASIFDKLPGQAYDGSNDRLVKAHMVKVTNNEDLSKVCDLVDLRLAAGDDWHAIENEGLTIEGTDRRINDMESMYWILNGLHNGAGYSWEEVKAALYSDEDAWI